VVRQPSIRKAWARVVQQGRDGLWRVCWMERYV